MIDLQETRSRARPACRVRLPPFGVLRLLRARRTNDRPDLLITAVRSEYQDRGAGAALVHEARKTAAARGTRYAEAGPRPETGPKVRARWASFESRQRRRRRRWVRDL